MAPLSLYCRSASACAVSVSTRVRRDPPGYFVGGVVARQARADVQELADSRVTGRVADGAGQVAMMQAGRAVRI